MLLYIGAVVFAFLCVVIAFWYYQWYHYMKYLDKLDGPMPLPIIGNALEFKDRLRILQTIQELSGKYGGIFKTFIGFDPTIFINDYKAMDFFLSSNVHIEKGIVYRPFWNWLGTGLLTSGGEKWRKRRKMITPTFHFQILEQFVEVFNSNSNVMVKLLEKEVGKGATDITSYITLCALDIICETAMGSPVGAQTNSESEYVKCVKTMCKLIIDRSLNPFESNEYYYRCTAKYQKELKILKVLHDYTNSIIKTRRDVLLKKLSSEQKEDETGIKKRLAFLDLLLQATIDGKPLSNEDIREEVDTFMFEGHDTTSSAMSFALFSIANQPEIQAKIMEEQNTIFGVTKNPTVTYKDLQEMRYLEMVIKETLRLFPSVPIIGRELNEDCTYDGLTTFRKGTQIVLCVHAIQRNPKYFPNPEKFDPERFSAENNQGKNPYCYVPFSAGPRNCIGQKFAMLEMKSTISKVVRNFELAPVVPAHVPIIVGETILKSNNGLLVKIVRKRN